VRRFLLLLICSCGAIAALGQYTSQGGRFQVDEIKGCAPFTVTITDTNVVTTGQCTGANSCLMDFEGKFGGNGGETNRFTYTYTTPGTYKLYVLYPNTTGGDFINITVIENKPPTFEVYTCTGNQVSIKVTDKSYETYTIDFNNDNNPETAIPSGNNAIAQHSYGAPGTYTIAVQGHNSNSANNCQILTEAYQTLATLPQPSINAITALDANNLKLDVATAPHVQYKLEIAQNNSNNFQVYKDLYQVSTETVGNLLIDNNYYCFRLSAYDPCANTNTYSNIMCSQDFDVAFQNGVNKLDWKTSTAGIGSTEIRRNSGPYSTLPGSPLTFSDTDYDCNQDYCYQIVTIYAGGRRSTSLQKCGTGILQTTFPAISNLSSVVRAGAELIWEADPQIKIKNFDIWRSSPGVPLTFLDVTTAQTYTDPSYNYQGGMCYQVNYSDNCGNKSAPGIVACPMVLTGTLDDKNAATLTWNSYGGYSGGVSSYQVDKYTSNRSLITSFTTTDTTLVDYDPADDEQIVIYTVTAIANEPGVEKSISNNITLEKEAKLILPTAFTPNGDGVNPLFSISGKYVSKMTIQIFDRWGVLVFSSDKNEPWDGTRGGKVMPESAYVWKAEVVDFAGHTFQREGTVLLLRPPR
jgi:gliding motility-associated-like protein